MSEDFVCPVCGEHFTTNIAKLVHLSIHHPGYLLPPPVNEPTYVETFVETYNGWDIIQITSFPPIHVEFKAVLIEGVLENMTEVERRLHYSELGEFLHDTFHVLHARNMSEMRMTVETAGQAIRREHDLEIYLRDNWPMLLMGAAYSGLLGLSMYQSYDWRND